MTLFNTPATLPVRAPHGERLRALVSRTREACCDDRGAATAEYAIATMAAVGLAGLLVGILRGDAVKSLLEGLITSAFHVAG